MAIKKANAKPQKQHIRPPLTKVEKDSSSFFLKWSPYFILAITAVIYSKAINNGLTSMDDDFYINKNPFLRDPTWHGVWAIFSSFYTSNYHPFTTLTFLAEYSLFGINPLSYHLINILLHLINTWLVFTLVQQLSGKRITAIVVAALFALHPMHVESVAWVSERKDVLYAAFYLATLIVYLRYLSSGLKANYYIGALLLFIASLFSKSAAVTLPVLLIAIDIYQGRKINSKSLLEKAPFFCLSLLFGILNIMAQSSGGSINNLMVSYSYLNRIFIFTSGLSFYFIKLIVPYNLCAMHFYPDVKAGFLPWEHYVSLPVLIGVVFLFLRRSAYKREMLFGGAFFLIALSVMLQVVSFGSAFASERYTYIPYIGLFYIAGQWVSKQAETSKMKTGIIGGFIVLLLVFSGMTWQRIDIWKDDMTLFSDIIEKYPGEYIGYWLRGNLEKQDGNLPDALQDYTKAISINPKDGDSYFNRGKIHDDMKDPGSAIKDYGNVIKLNNKSADAYNNRGWAYFETGDTAAAMSDYSNAIAINPKYAEAYNNRGWAYFTAGNIQAAQVDYTNAITNKPAFIKPYYNRAVVFVKSGNFAAALADYNSIITQHPDLADAYYYRGITHLNMKDTTKACTDWKQARDLGFEKSREMLGAYCK